MSVDDFGDFDREKFLELHEELENEKNKIYYDYNDEIEKINEKIKDVIKEKEIESIKEELEFDENDEDIISFLESTKDIKAEHSDHEEFEESIQYKIKNQNKENSKEIPIISLLCKKEIKEKDLNKTKNNTVKIGLIG
jgi:uncharacterized protein YbbC (DUF1343 family)